MKLQIPKKDHAFLQKSERIQTCYIARLFLYILAALCGHHLKDFTLLSSFSDAFFFARHPTTYEVHSYFFMRQRGNSVIVFCECNIVKRKTVCTTPQCWLLLQHSKNSGQKKKKRKKKTLKNCCKGAKCNMQKLQCCIIV